MDGGTFSASSLVAAKLRQKQQTRLLGDESGGGANGSNAMLMPTLILPRTKLRVTLPLYRIRHETNGLPGRGLIPDLYLLPDLVKKAKGLDTELEYLGRNLIWFEKQPPG
jgi:C-terminal processing protease CtpA/Prc